MAGRSRPDCFLLAAWAMLPALRLVVGDTQWVLSTHALLVVVAVLAGAVHAVRRAREPLVVAACVPLVAAAGIAGSRALFALLRGGGTVWSGGLTSMGGIVAGLAVVVVTARVARVGLGGLLDAFVPAGLLALGIGRVGCFLGGCCYGAPTRMPWGVAFPEVPGDPRHPLQFYSALLDFGLVGLLGRVAGPPGAVARAGCVGFGLGRAALELLRDPGTRDLVGGGGLTVAQAGGLALAVVALLVRPRRRHDLLARIEA